MVSTSSTTSPRAAGPPSSVYLFCLTAISTFFLAVIASGGLLSSYETVAAVVLRWPQGYFASVPEETESARLLPRENLLAAVAKVGLEESDLTRLHVDGRRHEAGELHVTVRYCDADLTRANTLVNEVAEECTAGHQRQAQRHLQQTLTTLREQIERTQHERWALVEEIDRYLRQVLPQLKLSYNSWESDPYRKRLRMLAAPPGAASGVLLTSAQSTEVDTAELRTEIAEREAQLQKLLEHMTAEHPQVQILEHDINLLKASLLSVAPLDAATTKRPAQTGRSPKAPTTASLSLPAAASGPAPSKHEAAFAAQMEQYRQKFAKLNAAHQTLAQSEREVWLRYSGLHNASLAHAEPARRTVQLDRPRWQQFLALMAVLSVSLGFGTVMIAKRGNAAFVTPQQVRRELPLPVVGVLHRGDAAALSAGLLAYRVQRGIKIGCECVLGGVMLWLLTLAFLNDAFLNELCADPLAAVALAWQRTLG